MINLKKLDELDKLCEVATKAEKFKNPTSMHVKKILQRNALASTALPALVTLVRGMYWIVNRVASHECYGCWEDNPCYPCSARAIVERMEARRDE